MNNNSLESFQSIIIPIDYSRQIRLQKCCTTDKQCYSKPPFKQKKSCLISSMELDDQYKLLPIDSKYIESNNYIDMEDKFGSSLYNTILDDERDIVKGIDTYSNPDKNKLGSLINSNSITNNEYILRASNDKLKPASFIHDIRFGSDIYNYTSDKKILKPSISTKANYIDTDKDYSQKIFIFILIIVVLILIYCTCIKEENCEYNYI